MKPVPVPSGASLQVADLSTVGVTIRDVAEKAGVSPATVSRVFNGGDVSTVTRTRVRSVAQALSYVPNAAARSLSTNRTRVLGFAMPIPHSEFFAELLRGVHAAATEAGYGLLMTATQLDSRSSEGPSHPIGGRVDGLLLVTSNREEVADYSGALPDVPKVWMLCRPPDVGCCIQVDNVGGAKSAVKHLLELGHCRIAHIVGRSGNWDAEERLEGYRTALAESGIAYDPALVVRGEFTRSGGYEAAMALLRLSPRPTAIFAANDNMAIGALAALNEAGLAIPRDMAIIGFDSIPSCCYMVPPLSSVRVPIREMGRTAAERLIGLVEHGQTQSERIIIETELAIRSSTVAAAGRQELLAEA